MARKLSKLNVRMIALVDKGANQEADIVIAKRAKQDYTCPDCGAEMSSQQELDTHMAQEHGDAQKALEAKDQELETVKQELEALKAAKAGDPHVETFKDEYERTKKELADTRKALGEEREKAAKELQESREELVKVQKQRRRERFIKRAQELGDLPGAPADDFAEILDHIEANQVTPKEFAKLNDMLTSWNVIVAKSRIFSEIGTGGDVNFSGPLGQLQSIAREKMAGDPKLTFEKAFAQAIAENPTVYRKYREDLEGK